MPPDAPAIAHVPEPHSGTATITPSGHRVDAAIIAASLPTAVSLLWGFTGLLPLLMTVLGLAGALVAARLIPSDGNTPRTFWFVIAVLGVMAVARSPIGSHDLWSYAFEGRMVSLYGVDPYRAVPAQFPDDVLAHVVGWTHTPSGYGPLFIAFSAAAMRVAGDSLLAIRLSFQVAAAAAVVGSLVVVHRVGHPRELVLVGLTPFVWVSLVNGGHNDALVAVAVVAAVVCFDRQRWLAAGVLVACAGLIKLSGLLVIIPLAAPLVARRRWRDAAVLALAPVSAVVLSALLLPRSLANASDATRQIISRASIWRPVSLLRAIPPSTISAGAMGLVAVVIVAIAWRHREDRRGSFAAGSSLATFGLAASYTLTWYQFWGLPTLALTGDLTMVSIVVVRGSLMQASYQLTGTSAPVKALEILLSGIAPIMLFVAFITRVAVPRSPMAARGSGPSRRLTAQDSEN